MPTESIITGLTALLFNANAAAAPVNGAAFALGMKSGQPNQGRTVTWKNEYASAPASVDIRLQGAMHFDDPDAEWRDLDASTAVGGEIRVVTNVLVPFIRARKAAQSGGGALTTEVLL